MTNTILCTDVFGNKYSCSIDNLTMRVGVYAVIIRENKILLTKQWNGYSIVGGGVDKGETLEQAFIREVQEETGLIASPGRLIHQATTFFQRDSNSQPVQSFQFYFLHSGIDGEINNNSITSSEMTYTNGVPEWVSIDTIEDIDFRHSVDLDTIINAWQKSV